ncbi:MAG: 30S ribosomal protein S13 [Candidatus Thermoplasmatota archaeon]|jgi:small subunit ribosomal protein S13|nr:30S ribosomal protein S13 [Candidatus Thermoplasmatota archaeon]MDA8142487.1 30S ribosomal protein S13 [Thermoplasmatales archaeon]
MAQDQKEKRDDFQYIVRIASKDLNGERSVELALADLKGVGIRLSDMIILKLGLPKNKKIGELSEEQIDQLSDFVESEKYEGLPSWALNHRREMVSGDDLNLVTNDLDIQIQDDINAMKKIKCYRGVRHERGKKVRGQRTRSNGRKGLTVGVQRKKD